MAGQQPWFDNFPANVSSTTKMRMRDAANVIKHYRIVWYKFGIFMSIMLNEAYYILYEEDFWNNNATENFTNSHNTRGMICVRSVVTNQWTVLISKFLNTLIDDQEVFVRTQIIGAWSEDGMEAFIEFWSNWLVNNAIHPDIMTNEMTTFREKFPFNAILSTREQEFVRRLTKNNKLHLITFLPEHFERL